MKSWQIGAVLSISLVLILGMQSGAFAESKDGSKSCPFKGDKTNWDKSGVDYPKHRSNEITSTSVEGEQLPSWVKANAKWWSTGQLNDSEFATGIKFLMDKEIITIPNNQVNSSPAEIQTPSWVKTTAGWWSDGLVSDAEFVSGLQHLVNIGII